MEPFSLPLPTCKTLYWHAPAVLVPPEDIAKSVDNTGDVYFVPAFSGLYAPYWETDARGVIIGITNFTNKAHLCRATLEAVCFQSREVRVSMSSILPQSVYFLQIIQCMNKDSFKGRLEKVSVDGGMTRNTFLLQLLANILGIPVGMAFPSLPAPLAPALQLPVGMAFPSLPSSA